MIMNLSTFYRTSLSGEPSEDVDLAEEIELQKLYLDIEAVRFPERLLVRIDLPPELAGAAVPGMNVAVLAYMLVYSLGIMGIITPYATGPSPVYFGSGYVSKKDFWLLGLIFGAIFLAVLLIVETPYLFMLHP